MKAAACSCRTVTNWISFDRAIASTISRCDEPTNPKTWRTPSARRHSTMASPVFTRWAPPCKLGNVRGGSALARQELASELLQLGVHPFAPDLAFGHG